MKNITEILAELTLDEKVSLLEGTKSWNTNGIPRLKIPSLFLTDGPHGLRKVRKATGGFGVSDNEHSTAFPTSATVASSWNIENAYRMGEAIAEECIASEVHTLLAPGVNIKRGPLCGRNFEYFSEDPLVSGVFGEAFVKGVQSKGIGCSVKHFAANSNENYRFIGDSILDERAFREIYLRAFERVVKQAKPYTLMCSYNRINGTFASQNKLLLSKILRDEWGFDGLVLTDWGATCDRVEGVLAGCDLDMPGDVQHNRISIKKAVQGGEVPIEILDRAAGRVLTLIEKCKDNGNKLVKRDFLKEHAVRSCEIAKDSAVLLKNDGQLPLTGKEKLLVVGEMFEKMRYQGAGSSLINPTEVITPKNAFEKRGISYTYEKGYRCFYTERNKELEEAALRAADDTDLVLFFGGLTDFEESEGFDREHLRMGENQTELIQSFITAGKKVILILFAGAPVELPFYDRLSALLTMYLPGMHGGEATAALLYGETVPSGKLTESWTMNVTDTSCFADYNCGPISRYYESIYVGYRYYDKTDKKLRFPFGFGLSYTSFQYNNLKITKENGIITVNADITNTGKTEGSEIVQLYVKNNKSKVFKAEKELRGFTKVFLQPDETKNISISFDEKDLSYWNVKRHGWILENGDYEILLAASSADIRLRADLIVRDGEDVESPYSKEVENSYHTPPKEVPNSFQELTGGIISDIFSDDSLTLESTLQEFNRTIMGKILYKAIMGIIQKDYKKAQKLSDSLERDTRLKNSYFLVRMMPSNSLRSMCMSSGGQFSYNIAQGFVELANGHIIRGLKKFLKKEKN
jgi:Beta-glucosidase-related glycosidases